MRIIISVVGIIALLSGCNSTPTRNYTGQANPTSFATVITGGGRPSSGISISRIDHMQTFRRRGEKPTVVDVSPGKHSYYVEARNKNSSGEYQGTLYGSAESGHIYLISFEKVSDEKVSDNVEPMTFGAYARTLESPQSNTSAAAYILSPPFVCGTQEITSTSALLDCLNIVKSTDDLAMVVGTSAKISNALYRLESKLGGTPHLQAKAIIDSAKILLERIREEYQTIQWPTLYDTVHSTTESKSSKEYRFVIREAGSTDVLAFSAATYVADPAPSYNNYKATYVPTHYEVYVPPTKSYYTPPPPSSQSYYIAPTYTPPAPVFSPGH